MKCLNLGQKSSISADVTEGDAFCTVLGSNSKVMNYCLLFEVGTLWSDPRMCPGPSNLARSIDQRRQLVIEMLWKESHVVYSVRGPPAD